MGGSPDERCGTTLSSEVYQARMLQLIKKFAMTGSRGNFFLPVLRRFDPSNIFNADETRLYWRLLPDKTHAIAGEVCTGEKKSKERVTVLVCANMSSSEKLSLSSHYWKFKKPRCFRGVMYLSTVYEANTSAWMTSAIFEEWLRR